jgi:hypothetical protein
VARVLRTDIGELRPVERRADGTIRVDAYLTRCGVFTYMQPDGSVRKELRLPDDVYEPESLRSFEGVPVTNEHPPGMLDAKNARHYQVGSVLGAPSRDDDHVRGRMSVTDHDTVQAMESGKTQVSCGYTCDCVEAPGVHPDYGAYDAVQKNIRGNHVAVVDRARAGVTAAARMDGWQVNADGTHIAFDQDSCDAPGMALADAQRTDAKSSAGAQVDPNDLAARNARGETSAKPDKKRQPGTYVDRGGDVVRGAEGAGGNYPNQRLQDDDDDDDDDDEDEPMDAYDSSYDDDGDLTSAARHKIKASNFAVPDKEQLPIHDKPHLKAAMSRFGQTDFEDADEKHGAFNRIVKRAKDFNVNSEGFQKAHGNKLDRADGARQDDNTMTADEIKQLQAKASKRKEKLAKAKEKLDAAEKELTAAKEQLATAQGQVENLTRDLDAAKKAPARADSSDADIQARVDAKVDLVVKATATGAKFDSKLAPIEIKRAVIKHVDKKDVAADKHEAYVDALFEGALERARKDAQDTAAGAAALGAIRQAANVDPAQVQAHADAADTDEASAKKRLDAANKATFRNHTGHSNKATAMARR